MAWVTPKVDWTGYHTDTQVFDPTSDNVGANDFNRIEGNTQYLKDNFEADGITVKKATLADTATTAGTCTGNSATATYATSAGNGVIRYMTIITLANDASIIVTHNLNTSTPIVLVCKQYDSGSNTWHIPIGSPPASEYIDYRIVDNNSIFIINHGGASYTYEVNILKI